MDRAHLEQLLQEVESLLARDERNIAHQLDVIATLERGGHDAIFAKMFLKRLQSLQSKHNAERLRLLNELAD